MGIQNFKGDWALVTGASSGIGLEFCKQLGAAGVNVVLVARREDILSSLATTLAQQHKIQTLVVAEDLSLADVAKRIHEKTEAEGIRIRLLINNAGVGRWGGFENSSLAQYQEMISTNIAAVVALTYTFLPDLGSFTQSCIINVSSPAAYQPVPYMAVYAATKSFVQSFSLALYGELAEKNIYVQTLIPAPTATEFDQKAGAYQSAVNQRESPEALVRLALAKVDSNEPVVAKAQGIFKQRFFAGLFPPKMVVTEVMKMFKPPN